MELSLFNQTLPEDILSYLKKGKFPHAVIIEGGSAQLRRDTAVLCAAALICSDSSEKPCGKCPSCKKIADGNHPDIITVTGTEKANSLGIDKIRDIRAGAYIVPNEAPKKVYLILGASSMSEQAQNGLLKILEEPPEYASFIIECPSKASLLSTVLSRCVSFSLAPSEDSAISDEKLQKAKSAAEQLARSLTLKGEVETMKATAVFEKDKELLRLALPELELIFRDAVVLKYGGKPVSSFSQTAELLCDTFGAGHLTALVGTVPKFMQMINRNANHNLLITELCCCLRHVGNN